MLIMAVPFITYTALGGLWASAITNIVKFMILVAGLLVLIPTAIIQAGGWDKLTAALPAGSLNLFSSDAMLFVWAFFWVMTLSMWVPPDIYQMLFSARSVRTAKIGLGFAGILMILMGLAAAFIGLSARSSFLISTRKPQSYSGQYSDAGTEGFCGYRHARRQRHRRRHVSNRVFYFAGKRDLAQNQDQYQPDQTVKRFDGGHRADICRASSQHYFS